MCVITQNAINFDSLGIFFCLVLQTKYAQCPHSATRAKVRNWLHNTTVAVWWKQKKQQQYVELFLTSRGRASTQHQERSYMILCAYASSRQTWLEANTAHRDDTRLSESDCGAALSIFSPEWDDSELRKQCFLAVALPFIHRKS